MHFSELFGFCPVCGSSEFKLNNFKSKKCDNCGFVFYINPSAAVAAFIVNENKELLISIRAHEPAKNTWDLPGGFVDDDETAEEALIREIKEELNLETDCVKYLFSVPNKYEYSGFTVPTLDLFYEVQIQNFSKLEATDDVLEAMFVPFDKIDIESFGLPSIKKAVKYYLENKI